MGPGDWTQRGCFYPTNGTWNRGNPRWQLCIMYWISRGGGWLSYPPPRRSPRGELCPDLPSRPALPTTCPTEKKNPSKPHNCLPLHAGTFPSRLLGVGLVWWVAPLPARSRACRLSLSLAISRLAPAACVATASVAISRSNLIKSLWIYLLAV